MVRFDPEYALPFIGEGALSAVQPEVNSAHKRLLDKSGAGSDMLGWRRLLLKTDQQLIRDIENKASEIIGCADVLLCVGIGGSYLGAEAVIEALNPYFGPSAGVDVIFVGHHMSGAYLKELMESLEGKSVYLNVISKSGTTLEPALAFRFLRSWMEKKYSDADDRIIVTTDADRGALNQLQKERCYKKYVIPSDVGGRFSVLTPVGLLPIACAGIDIRLLIEGATDACTRLTHTENNDASAYAGLRYLLLKKGYDIEILATFEPRFAGIGAWWQQLFGESEGKEHTGLYPSSVQYSTDLHSLGQYVQDGQRNLIETFLMTKNDGGEICVPSVGNNLDGLDYLAGQSMSYINRKAFEGTSKAHFDGGVPNMSIWFDSINPFSIGECLYFFEHAVSVSGYLLGINPFDQPGVEDYKIEMFRRLGCP